MFSTHNLYHTAFKTKLKNARQLYQEKGEALCAVPLISKGLVVLEQQVRELQEHMAFLNLAPLCVSCASKPGGGCCSLYMADENDAVLLLINLLAGHPVAIQKDDGFECYLLGSEGCVLRFKPMFCLNYNCRAIKTHIDADSVSAYLAASGKLLQTQWEMEKEILDYLR